MIRLILLTCQLLVLNTLDMHMLLVGVMILKLVRFKCDLKSVDKRWWFDVGQSTPIYMQHSTFPLVSASDCQQIWQNVVTITDRMQCVGGDGLVSVCSVRLWMKFWKIWWNLNFTNCRETLVVHWQFWMEVETFLSELLHGLIVDAVLATQELIQNCPLLEDGLIMWPLKIFFLSYE